MDNPTSQISATTAGSSAASYVHNLGDSNDFADLMDHNFFNREGVIILRPGKGPVLKSYTVPRALLKHRCPAFKSGILPEDDDIFVFKNHSVTAVEAFYYWLIRDRLPDRISKPQSSDDDTEQENAEGDNTDAERGAVKDTKGDSTEVDKSEAGEAEDGESGSDSSDDDYYKDPTEFGLWLSAWLIFQEFYVIVPQNLVMKRLCRLVVSCRSRGDQAFNENDIALAYFHLRRMQEYPNSAGYKILLQFINDALLIEMCRDPYGEWLGLVQHHPAQTKLMRRTVDVLSQRAASPEESSIDVLTDKVEEYNLGKVVVDEQDGPSTLPNIGADLRFEQHDWERGGGTWLLEYH
ncbi:hypothetical protein CLAFUW4_14344 [Fulvia fulva]|uniref:Uncharacterized protein n=1 Tax=Passalora fulva TaxID=5499 RepID=A0A9Q8PLT9_PASFU|nr:uncharacterized protein CLAFUR5_14174 [Fulvia fulva]KAK4609209.1 hypothetical protein CLAFUR4_14342 [Fulvia fulva]KAK4609639.1 hypothetical protein CLAFUR0_14346 [Fulvia fulva]UJO24900.1 hypothetical protein CLAFUR5_14174 [Fulvia fulva]WPV22840.1 hypothetical protein CLAFUW4_14344 [Fulvia fulva]WPV37483.1 hypothetical protein CLAFUW7_14350 [Fulvia fulva]